MLNAERRHAILERLSREGRVMTADLAQEWGVSEDSIRRDFRDLAEEGLIQRVHGGALPGAPAAADFRRRQSLASDDKRAVGAAAATLVQRGAVIGIDGGTTTLELVRCLPPDWRGTVVTHSPSIAQAFDDLPAVEVILIGGRYFRHSRVAVGAEAVDAVKRIRLDQFFLGATGLRADLGATTGDWEDAAVKRAFCAQAAEVILPVTPEKWGAASPFQIVEASALTCLVLAPGLAGVDLGGFSASVVRA